jgi:hypothetical protein
MSSSSNAFQRSESSVVSAVVKVTIQMLGGNTAFWAELELIPVAGPSPNADFALRPGHA